ncbi:MAG: putative ral stress protein, partial [Thermoleophilia bacterium]|nr:putative ral stress protein [Thermoleophilia bacterium]
LSEDRELIRELWTPFARAWFQGPDDPAICVLRFHPEEAEYWDTPKGGKPAQLLKFAAAALTGSQQRREDSGDHGRLNL